jgi:HD superfamily phosphohydrolase
MHQQVYFHKAARAAEWMICAVLGRAADLLRDGNKLPGALPALTSIAYHGDAPLGAYLELDDGALFAAMHTWESSSDAVLADLCRRIRGRSLFKTLELYGTDEASRAAALATARDIAQKRGLAPPLYVGLDVASDTPFSDDDDPLTVILPHGVAKKPGDVSFLLGRLRGETVTRVRLIFAPELREAITTAIPA